VSVLQSIDRIPPQNLEAEQSVLGSMLLDRDAIARVVESLRPEDFYRDVHRTIYTAILELFERGEPVDLITITNRLSGMGKLEDVGGAPYLASLPNAVPTAANADFYAGIVLEKSMLRALISVGTHIAALGYEGMDEVTALVDQAEKLVYGIASRRNIQDFQTIKEILKSSFEKIDKRYQEKGTVTGVATGFTDFDMLTSGLQPADMVIVAARPSVGKCLSRDAEILLEDGSIATIEEIVRRGRGRLLTLGADWKFRTTEPSAFVDDGVKPVFRVATRLGRRVECTATHPFLTPHGWLPLASLRIGERIAVPRKVEIFGNEPLRECEIKLLAYLIGDGPLTCQGGIIEDFAAAARAFGTVPRRHARTGHAEAESPARDLLALWLSGREPKTAGRTEIPATVFALPRGQLALFLNRLFAIDGWTSAPRESRIALIGYATTNEGLGRQVQHLLLRFGILAGLREPDATAWGIRRDAWRLEITDPASIRTFVHSIGIFGWDARTNGIPSPAEAARRTADTDPILPDAWRAIAAVGGKGPWTTLLARRGRRPSIARGPDRQDTAGDVYWDEIVSIEPAGEKQVYDLTVAGTHNFVANDICVHNTTFATNIAQHAAIAHKIPVAIFSLETSKEQLVQRILCSEARVDNTKLRTGFLADEDWRKLARAMGGLSEAPIFIDDSATLSIMEMRAKARKLKTEHGLGLMIIDYMQMIQSFKRAENRTQELSEIARGIKSLAKELDIPIIAISQLSRAVEALGSKRPMLSHLRESGEIEQVADLVVFLYREDYYDLEKAQRDNKQNICEIIIAKHRNGPIGTVELFFHKEFSRFENLEKRR